MTVVLFAGRGSAWAAGKGLPDGPATAAPAEIYRLAPTGSAAPAKNAPRVSDTYAEREKNAGDLEKFKGGDVVIVGTGGVIVVLLVIIILLSL